MAGLADLVSVTVVLSNPGVTLPGFGTPAILSAKPTWPERSRTYKQPSDVAADFLTTDPEYIAANAVFSQKPRPKQLKIIRAALKPTQVHVVTVRTVQAGKYVLNAFYLGVEQVVTVTEVAAAAWVINHAYVQGNRVTNDTAPVKVYECITSGTSAGAGGPTGTGQNITDNTAHWKYIGTSFGGVANDGVVEDLVAAFNALAAPTLDGAATATGTPGALVMTITAGTAGSWSAYEVPDRGLLSIAETTTDPGVATDLANILLADKDWYSLITPYASKAYILAAAAWTESNRKLYTPATADSAVPVDADGGASDVAHALKGFAYAYSAPFYHPRRWEFPDAALQGRFLAIDPGKDNWRLKTLVGVSPEPYTVTEQTNLDTKRTARYETLGPTNVVTGAGITSAGEYIDVTRFVDWWIANVQTDGANLLIQNEKIPYTDDGFALIGAMLRRVNKRGIDAGGIAKNPAPVVDVPLVADETSTDRQNRNAAGFAVIFTLAGAINSLAVNAQVLQ